MMHTGDDYFDSNEFKAILAAYEEAVSKGQAIFMDTDDLIDIADYYNMVGLRDKASATVDAALEYDPSATLPLVYKAREALADEDIKSAIDMADNIIDKDDYDYKCLKAEIMVAQDCIDEADAYLKEIFPTLEYAEHEDFVYDTAGMYLDYGVYDKAYEWLAECSDPDGEECLDMRGKALLGLGRHEEAVAIYEKLIDKSPRTAGYWVSLANAQNQSESYNDAITSCEYALALNPHDASGLFIKASSLYRLGNFEQALEYYQRYNEIAPKDGYGELNVGTTLLHLAHYDEALVHLRKAERQAQNASSGYLSQIHEAMALVYSSLGINGKAIEYIDKVPIAENDDEECVEHLIVRGHILLEAGRTSEAESMFRKAVIKSSCSPNVMLRVIVSLMDNKYTEVAYRMFKMYFSTFPNTTDGYAYMALCCWEMQNIDEFLLYFKKALTYNKNEATTVLANVVPAGIGLNDYLNKIISANDGHDKSSGIAS